MDQIKMFLLLKKKKEATFLRVSGNVCFPDLDVSPFIFSSSFMFLVQNTSVRSVGAAATLY